MADILSRSSRPLYQKVYDQLAAELGSGALTPGDRFPPERELCQRLNVSRVTLRRALKQLEIDGVLVSAPRGWLVAGALEKAPNELLGFSELARARGLEPTSQIIRARLRPASIDEAELLQVAPGSELVELVRLRLLDGVPTAVDDSCVPSSLVPGLLEQDLDSMSLYRTLENDHGIVVSHADYSVEARAADGEVAELLGVRPGEPLLVARQTTYDQAGVAVQHAQISYRGDRYRFRATLARRSGAGER